MTRGAAAGSSGADAGPIWLVGMMGCGKSTVGPLVAEALGRPFLDSDAEIERAGGRSVAEIFREDGEPAFRALEATVIGDAARGRAVVALGGGAIAQPGAADRLAASGTVVYLRAEPDALLDRIRDPASRPLLAGLDRAACAARLAAILREREPAYRTAAIAVDTDGRSASEVAREVAERVRGIPVAGRRVDVSLGDRSYRIEIGTDTLGEVGAAIAGATSAKQVAVVTVPEVGRRYAGRVLRSLRAAGVRARRIDVPDGDGSKSFRQLGRLYDAFLDQGLDRKSALVALGGGMVGDLTGFAAATYLRGIPFVQIPTTVLAMVDASIGGKTAVNLRRGKNLVGAFHQPALVFVDTATLRSLPVRQRAAGFAEVVKAAAIWDEMFFARLERDCEKLLALDPDALVPVLERACRIKAEVVARDEREETGVRALLNFGHTLAHAIEAELGYRKIVHGEAVSIGMVHAARRSEALGLAPAGTRERLEALLVRFGLPVDRPGGDRRAQLAAIRVDKKKAAGKIDYVVLRRIGRAETLPLTAAEILPRTARTTRSKRATG